MTVADTIEACIVDEDQAAKISQTQEPETGGFTIKVQGKHGQRDVTNIQIEPNQPLGNRPLTPLQIVFKSFLMKMSSKVHVLELFSNLEILMVYHITLYC